MGSKLSKLFFILLVFSFVFLVKATAAEAATLSLSPASGSSENGSTFTVDVKLNTGADQVKTGSVAISYPSDKLEAIVQPNGELFDSAGSPYSTTLGIPAPTGAIGFAFLRSAAPFPSGSSLQLARITFKAKVGSGAATVSFANFTTANGGTSDNSLIDANGAYITNLTLAGGTYTLTSPPSSPPPSSSNPPPANTGGSTPTSPTGSTSKTTTTTTSPSYVPTPTANSGDTTAPKISNVKVTDITINTAKITWTTDEPSTSIVEFNQTNVYQNTHKLILSAQSATLTTSHSITIGKDLLQVGYGYTFRVRSIDASGNSAESSISTFRTKGYSVRLKIVDKDSGEPLVNVKVTFTSENITKTTDADGVVIFDDVANMDQPLKVSFSGKVYLNTKVKVTGESGVGTSKAQTIEVKVAGIAQMQQTFRNIGWALILVGLAASAGVAVVWLKNRKKNPVI